ncbi:MAG: EboA domain-containing protein [Bacteroidia bacterium]
MHTKTSTVLEHIFSSIIRRNTGEKVWEWLQEEVRAQEKSGSPDLLNILFSSVQRKTGKSIIQLTEEEQDQIKTILPGFSLRNWSLDRLCRVWLLMQIDQSQKGAYIERVKSLFKNSEMNELVALYSALPVLAYPEEWKSQCAEGIRSNIGNVQEAVMLDNPYPSAWLDEAAWNQMILKAFFTEKDTERIVGLYERSNIQLALTLSDYAKERSAAGRPVNPRLWPLVEKFSKGSL